MKFLTATNIVIVVFLLVFTSSMFLPSTFVSQNYFFSLNNALNAHFHTAVIAIFMHANWFHLIFNSIFLFFFGNELESKIGAKKFLAMFIIIGIASFVLASPSYEINQQIVGASGSIFGIMSALAVVNPFLVKKIKKVKYLFKREEKPVILNQETTKVKIESFLLTSFSFLAFQIALLSFYRNIVVENQVSDLIHIIGFIQGLVFGIFWSDYWKNFVTKNLTKILAIIIILLFLSYTIVIGLNFFNLDSPFKFTKTQSEKCTEYCVKNGFLSANYIKGYCNCNTDIEFPNNIS